MICISIAQESRRLVLADMLNAARQCDLLEIQLDCLGKSPDLGELLAHKPKPLILSCRRLKDGGSWHGTEDDRLMLLRQCLVSKADYVEIELDVADQVGQLPPAKRVVSYTNLEKTPANIAAIYAEALKKQPDVVKLVTLARTPEEAWPLAQILSKAAVPTVVVGLGKPGVMLTLLGKKIGAPWAYAALERGMEAYPEQPTVRDLEEVYHYREIARTTPLVAVTGFSAQEYFLVAALNAGFAQLAAPARCLPIQVGNIRLFRKVMDSVKFTSVVVSAPWSQAILEVATKRDPAVEKTQSADLILHENKDWHAYNLLWRVGGAALESVLRRKHPVDRPLQDRMVMIVGSNPAARMFALGIDARGGIPIIASHDRAAAQKIAKELKCRFVPFEALYTTQHDVLVLCSSEEKDTSRAKAETGIHTGYLKPAITVMDLTSMDQKSALLRDAEERGCAVVTPRQMLLERSVLILRLLTRMEVEREQLEGVLRERMQDFE